MTEQSADDALRITRGVQSRPHHRESSTPLMRNKRFTPWLGAGLTVVLVGLAATPLFANKKDEEAEADKRIQAATVELKKLETDDERKAATAEIGKAEALRDKARSILGDRKEREALVRTLDEMEGHLALASAQIVESDAKADLGAERAKLEAAKQELATVRANVSKLEKEQAELDRQLGAQK